MDKIEDIINGVKQIPLKRILNDKGDVLHMLRSDAPYFDKFGEVYFSIVNHGVVKAWKKHLRMTQKIAVPVGAVDFVIYDDRERSISKGKIQKISLGVNNYCLLIIPPMLWYGFQGVDQKPSLIANCTDIVHDPSEVVRKDIDDPEIVYNWQLLVR
jgi:dTDP-4-dehydrorhamnose 3,5-epimerase